jgi:hypothetical protein
LARDLVGLAEEDADPAKLAVAHRALGYSLLIAGEFREAAETLARGATLADTISEGEFAIYGEHPSMVCRAYGGQVKILMGFPESGMTLIEAGVAHARHQTTHTALPGRSALLRTFLSRSTSLRQRLASHPKP